MHGIKDSKRLLRRPGLKLVFCCLVLLPALAAIPAGGQNSVITLAMVRYDQSPVRMDAVARNDPVAQQLAYVPAPRLQYQIAGVKLDHQDAISLSTDFLLENRNGSSPRDWLQLSSKKPNAAGWMGSGVHIKAGYGQFCQFESSLGKTTVELEQPSCAYFKAGFSF